MDKIDAEILNYLQSDSTITVKELASKLSLSPTPVYDRIRKLEKTGIIQQYVALLNPDLLNQRFVVFLHFTIKEFNADLREKLIHKLISFKEISELYQTSGSADYIAKARFYDIKEYKEFLVKNIWSLENVATMKGEIVLEEIKHNTQIRIDFKNTN